MRDHFKDRFDPSDTLPELADLVIVGKQESRERYAHGKDGDQFRSHGGSVPRPPESSTKVPSGDTVPPLPR